MLEKRRNKVKSLDLENPLSRGVAWGLAVRRERRGVPIKPTIAI